MTTTPTGTWACKSSFCGNKLHRPEGHRDGYCRACIQRWYRAGKPDTGPPPPRDPTANRNRVAMVSRAEVARRVEEFAKLRAKGLTIVAAAAQMGVSVDAAGHYSAKLQRQEAELALATHIDWPSPSPPRRPAERWTDWSACFGHGGLFFAPDGREEPADRVVREAQALSLCAVCPVRGKCLEDALERKDRTGIRAGLTEDERAEEERRRANGARNKRRRVAARRSEDEGAAA